jgi:hypothetical protein
MVTAVSNCCKYLSIIHLEIYPNQSSPTDFAEEPIKSRSAEGVVVVSGGETIVARDINIRKLKESGSVEAAQKLYYYYKFAEEDRKKASKWHEEWNRRLAAAQRGDSADPK